MEFFDVGEKRRSIRLFEERAVESDLIDRLLNAVRLSPTAGNLQAYQVYLVDKPETIQALAETTYGQECVAGAPLVLVFCADAQRSAAKYGERGASLYCIQDTTIAAMIGHFATTALGLGSVLVGAFRESAAAQVIGAPDHLRPLLMLPVGYPAESAPASGRRSLADLVKRIS